MKHSTAYFVSMPFRLEDLRRPHLNSARKPYAVEKTVELAKIDYENFITDLCVDRWFMRTMPSCAGLTATAYGIASLLDNAAKGWCIGNVGRS